jgi:hypothetical protein
MFVSIMWPIERFFAQLRSWRKWMAIDDGAHDHRMIRSAGRP